MTRVARDTDQLPREGEGRRRGEKNNCDRGNRLILFAIIFEIGAFPTDALVMGSRDHLYAPESQKCVKEDSLSR